MIIGVPKEIKIDESRVSLLPVGAEILIEHGHQVLIETQAGSASGFSDDQYLSAGATVVSSAQEVYQRADLIIKVKEPLPQEHAFLREGQIIFTYFHFAASEKLTRAIIRTNCIAIAYETIETPDGHLPLLTPMSEIAGHMAVQQAAKYLEREQRRTGGFTGWRAGC